MWGIEYFSALRGGVNEYGAAPLDRKMQSQVPNQTGYTEVMTPKITPEMRDALAQSPGRPVPVEDEVAQRTYLLVDAERGRDLIDQWIRDQLQIGLDAADRGEVTLLAPAEIKRSGAERRAAQR